MVRMAYSQRSFTSHFIGGIGGGGGLGLRERDGFKR